MSNLHLYITLFTIIGVVSISFGCVAYCIWLKARQVVEIDENGEGQQGEGEGQQVVVPDPVLPVIDEWTEHKDKLDSIFHSYQRIYKSISPEDFHEFKLKRDSYMVVHGKESCHEEDATVTIVNTIEEVGTIRRDTTVVFYWGEFFSEFYNV